MTFPFVVNNRPVLLICATRDRLKDITDHQSYQKMKALHSEYINLKPNADTDKLRYATLEPGQTWSEMIETVDKFTPATVFILTETSLNKMPLYKKQLAERISKHFGPRVAVNAINQQP